MRHVLPLVLISLAFAGAGAAARADDPPAPPKPAAPSEPPAAPAPVAPTPPAAPVVSVPAYPNGTCPIMGRPSSRALFAETEFGRIYVCCPPCIAKIKADPARAYSTAYPTTKKVGNTVCPVTGETIEGGGVPVVLQGYEVSLCCSDCVAKAKADAQVVLTKALKPDVVDLGNRTSPISGKPVADNVFVLVDADMIHLAAASEVEDVKRDPEKARKAAKEIAAKQAAEEKPKEAPSAPPRH